MKSSDSLLDKKHEHLAKSTSQHALEKSPLVGPRKSVLVPRSSSIGPKGRSLIDQEFQKGISMQSKSSQRHLRDGKTSFMDLIETSKTPVTDPIADTAATSITTSTKTRRETLSSSLSSTFVTKTKHAVKVKKALKSFLSPSGKKRSFSRKAQKDVQIDKKEEYVGPTFLHSICRNATSIDEIIQAFQKTSYEAHMLWEKDTEGRNCVHLLGLNTAIVPSFCANRTSNTKKGCIVLDDEAISTFTEFLTRTLFPDQVNLLIEEDNNRRFPFEEPIQKWVHSLSPSTRKSVGVSLKNTVKMITSMLHSSSQGSGRIKSVDSEDTDATIQMSSSGDQAEEDKLLTHGATANMNILNAENVVLPLHIQLILKLLSGLLDTIRVIRRNGRSAPLHGTNNIAITRPQRLRSDLQKELMLMEQTYEERIASIPEIMLILISIEDDFDRKNIFDSSIVKRIMIRKESLGPWLSIMLQDNRSNRIVEYLSQVSDILTWDIKVIHHSRKEQQRFERRTNEFCDAFGELDTLFPSMLALPSRLMEEVATLPFMTQVLDRLISTPFMAVQLFVDTLLTAVLIFCFRKSVDGYLLGFDAAQVLRWVYAVNACVFYLLIRELAKIVSLIVISKTSKFLRSQIIGITISMSSLFILISCVLTIRITVPLSDDVSSAVRARLALTSGLLWIRLLTVMKSINIKLATFVMAIVQITLDTFWYMMILLAIVFCFAQVFFTLLVPYKCSAHSDNPDFQIDAWDCNPSEYYLKVYFVMLGQDWLFQREDFNLLPLLVFIGFSFLIAVVLLNVLIAIIGDSYERCLLRSRQLFGRARIVLLAELVALRDLFQESGGDIGPDTTRCYLHPSRSLDWAKRIRWSKGGVMFTILSACALVGWIISEIYAQSHGTNLKHEALYSIMIVAINIFVFAFFLFILSDRSRSSGNVTRLIEKLMRKLLGKGQDAILTENDEWKGRMHYLSTEMQRLNKNVLEDTKLWVHGLENHTTLAMNQMERRLENKVNHLSKRIEELLSCSES